MVKPSPTHGTSTTPCGYSLCPNRVSGPGWYSNRLDPPDWGVWVAFAALFVLLESFAVEVNDRLLQSAPRSW